MSVTSQRAIFSNDGQLTDVSIEFASYNSGELAMTFIAGEDYLYVGCDLPFNQKYFDLGQTTNEVAASVQVELWDGRQWAPAIDVIDRTASGGKSLAQSGYISWCPDPDRTWARESESEDVAGLDGTNIYGFYWARFSWSASLTPGVVIKHLGHKFSEDADLYGQYPGLNNAALKHAFSTGKTDWSEQAFMAAEVIIADLVARNVILSGAQILDHQRFRMASIHKTAEIIYRGLGDNEGNAKAAADAYRAAMSMKKFWVDLNQDGRLQEGEKHASTVFLTR